MLAIAERISAQVRTRTVNAQSIISSVALIALIEVLAWGITARRIHVLELRPQTPQYQTQSLLNAVYSILLQFKKIVND